MQFGIQSVTEQFFVQHTMKTINGIIHAFDGETGN